MDRRVALKVDCDTFEGTKSGLPTLLRIFDKLGIQASFFFTLGPDRSGRAIRRVFTQKGFLKKMLRTNAVSMYGPKTMLYGTLLPAPIIGKKLKAEIRSVAAAGHEVGVHGWDHVHWHDHLDRLTPEEVETEYRSAHVMFEDIFGRKALASAAPGWHATPTSLMVQERFNIVYASDTRGGPPFYPRSGNHVHKFLEIPTTLPTLDETLGHIPHNALLPYYRAAVRGTEVHTIHTEVEGMAYAGLFEEIVHGWKINGFGFLKLEQLANEIIQKRTNVRVGELKRIVIPNRGGYVSSGI